MQVLFLSHNRSDSDDAYNYRLRRLAAALEAEGIGVSISYLGDPPLGKPTLLHPLKISRVEAVRSADIVHAGSAAVAFTCAFLPRKGRPKIVFDMHGDTVAEQKLRARGGWDMVAHLRVLQERIKERVGLRASDAVAVVSEPLRDHVARCGVSPGRVAVVRNGVDLDRFPVVAARPSGPDPLVVYAGRFDAWQGVENLLFLAARAGRGFRLRVIGFGPGDQEVKERIRSLSEGAVEVRERLPQDELAEQLADADLLLIPRERNRVTEVAMPTKFSEYLSLGRPILMTRVGEPARLVERARCGVVVEPGGEALLEGIRSFAAFSEEERAGMGERARALAESEFDWRKIGPAYARFLRAWIEER